jgi:FkbM family methyltransferase
LDWQNIETASCRYGTMSYLKSDRILGRALREYGEWAQGELNFLLDLIDVGNTVIDVGAFMGTHTLAFARHVGPRGQVYAFEPHPVAFGLLKLNVEKNDLSNVKLFNVALSDCTGTINSYKANLADTDSPGSFSLLTEVDVAAESSGISIDVMTLDQVDIDRCHLVKVDVEGMELNVLKGSTKTLRRFRPLVFAECLSLHNGWQIILFMRDNGFEAFLHNERAFNPDNFKRNASNFFGDARETNIVFVPTNRLSAFRERCKYFENLIPLKTLDDLALGMLKKPQYKYEVLAPTSAAKILDIDFFANEPELRHLADTAEARLQEKVAQIHGLESQIHGLESQIQQIQQSILMQLVSRYQRIVEKLLRPGTRRRRYYELMLNDIRVILNEGWKSFWYEFRHRYRQKHD